MMPGSICFLPQKKLHKNDKQARLTDDSDLGNPFWFAYVSEKN